ncbi:hypothetical protein [Nereida ignava]
MNSFKTRLKRLEKTEQPRTQAVEFYWADGTFIGHMFWMKNAKSH